MEYPEINFVFRILYNFFNIIDDFFFQILQKFAKKQLPKTGSAVNMLVFLPEEGKICFFKQNGVMKICRS